jgi:hypothetical protein
MSDVIDIKTKKPMTDLPSYVVEDCQGEMVQATRRLEAAGSLHQCIKDMQKEFGEDFAMKCLHQEYTRIRTNKDRLTQAIERLASLPDPEE